MQADVPHAGPFARVPVTMFVFGLKYACLEKSHDKLTLMSKATLKKKKSVLNKKLRNTLFKTQTEILSPVYQQLYFSPASFSLCTTLI